MGSIDARRGRADPQGSGNSSSLDFGAQQSVSVDVPRRTFGAAGRPDSLGLGPSVSGRPRIPRGP